VAVNDSPASGGGWLDKIRIPLAALGSLGLLLAGAFALVAGEFSVASRLSLAVGILLLGMYVAIDPGKAWGALRSRESVYGSNAILISVAFIGILVVANVLGNRFHQRWDLTAQRDFSLSDATLKQLRELPAPVHATAFFSGSLRDKQKTEDLLKEYEARSDGKLTWEMVDTFADPVRPRLEGINVDGTIRFKWADGREGKQDTITSDEAHITTALIKLVAPTPMKLYYIIGHGERELEKFDDEGYSDLKTQIQADNFVVETLNLLATGQVPADAAAIMLAAPKTALQEAELNAIKNYLDAKGRMILFVDPFQPESNAEEIIKRWDLSLGKDDGVVLDPVSSLQGSPLTLIVAERYGMHSIVRDLGGQMTVMPFTTSIEIPNMMKRSVDVSSLAQSYNDRSWLETARDRPAAYDEGEDKKGPLTLAVAVEEVENPPTEDLPPGFEDPNKRVKNRAVIIGTSEMGSNGLVKQPVANRDFIVNSLNWVTQTDQLISARPRIEERRSLFLTPTQSNFVFFSSFLFLPLLLLGAGAFVWWTRR
jgi:ABC-type uncharacterized transport system involved in gliding motility auxiliary subunit